MLRAESLSVGYGRVRALRDASLHVGSGEIVCLVGSNGAGKSSCLLGLMGLTPATGAVSVDGVAVAGMQTGERVAKGLALVPEGRHVFPAMTVSENLRLGFRAGSRDVYDERLEEILGFFPRLKERLQQLAGGLSGGEQQMLALGRALMSGPKFLLLDEPTLGLAPIMVARVAEVLALLRARNIGLLLAEQNLRMALEIADRGYVVAGGEIILEGDAAALGADPRVRKSYLGLA